MRSVPCQLDVEREAALRSAFAVAKKETFALRALSHFSAGRFLIRSLYGCFPLCIPKNICMQKRGREREGESLCSSFSLRRSRARAKCFSHFFRKIISKEPQNTRAFALCACWPG